MPQVVPSEVVDKMQQRIDESGCVSTGSLVLFQPGDKVRITDGAFQEHEAVFQILDDKQRVHLLLNFMQRQTKVRVPLYAVEKV